MYFGISRGFTHVEPCPASIDVVYIPLLQEDLQKLGDAQALVAQLYEAFNVREYHVDMERAVIAELEDIRLQLEPMEQVKNTTKIIVLHC